MKTCISVAAFSTALLTGVACLADEFPFSAPNPAEGAFADAIPTIADLPLGLPYETAKSMFLSMSDTFSLSSAKRELTLTSDTDGSVEFMFDETLLAEPIGAESDFREERTAIFSSPLTGSQLLIVERRLSANGDTELSVPAAEAAIVAALGLPTGKLVGATLTFGYVWLDGRLVATGEIPQLETTPFATIEGVGINPADLNEMERHVDECSRLASIVQGDALIDTMNAIADGNAVPERCTAVASVYFQPGSQSDLARGIVVRIAYSRAIIDDAKAVRKHMSDALQSGAGRKPGVAISNF